MTERTKHTPGPWTAHASAVHGPGTHTGRETTIAVACGHIAGGSPVSQANARLIAAAPELLEAAIKTIEENGHLADGDVCTLIHLKRAVAKATGNKSAAAADCPTSAGRKE